LGASRIQGEGGAIWEEGGVTGITKISESGNRFGAKEESTDSSKERLLRKKEVKRAWQAVGQGGV